MRLQVPGLLCAAALALASTMFQPSAEAADIESLRERAQAMADRVTEFERRLSDLEDRKDGLAQEIGDSSAEIGVLEIALNDAERSVDAARETLEERAVEVYKSSITGDDLEKLLSASSLHELEMIAEVQVAAAQADEGALEEFQSTADEAELTQSGLEERKSRLLSAQQEVAEVEAEIDESLVERRSALADLADEIKALQEEARAAAREAAEEAEREAEREAELAEQETTYPEVPSNLPAPTGDLAARLEGTGPTNTIPELFTTTGVKFEGEASWYGPGFEGNLTANGDVYDSSLFTAASKTLPLNTYLFIRYEGRGCVVLVNDRGPYVGNRILDLSRGTAAAIGMERAGIGWVTAEILVRG